MAASIDLKGPSELELGSLADVKVTGEPDQRASMGELRDLLKSNKEMLEQLLLMTARGQKAAWLPAMPGTKFNSQWTPSMTPPEYFPRATTPPQLASSSCSSVANSPVDSCFPLQSRKTQAINEPLLDFYPIIPAGGSGTRLWPLSRDSWPKFLLDLEGKGSTLLQSTFDRLATLSGKDRIVVVTGEAHVKGVAAQVPELSTDNIFAEPSPKESMAAIGLAAAILYRRDSNAVIASFAADHVIDVQDGSFANAVATAVNVARASNDIVTIGITPDEPSTAFGYIHVGSGKDFHWDGAAYQANQVTRFKEKPAAAEAADLLASGEYSWNAGMFVAKASALLELLSRYNPTLYEGLQEIAASWNTAEQSTTVSRVWPDLPKISIDHAIAEPAAATGRMLVIRAPLQWKDVGDYGALTELAPHASERTLSDAVRVLGDSSKVFTQECSGLFVPAGGKLIACLGIQDVVVVDTPSALFITLKDRSQDIKDLVALCKKACPDLR